MPTSSRASRRSRSSARSRKVSTSCRRVRSEPPMSDAHILPDLLVPGLTLVFCGTAPSSVSAARRAYYAGPGNRFWSILAETGLTPRRLEPEEYGLLPQFGIGL